MQYVPGTYNIVYYVSDEIYVWCKYVNISGNNSAVLSKYIHTLILNEELNIDILLNLFFFCHTSFQTFETCKKLLFLFHFIIINLLSKN